MSGTSRAWFKICAPELYRWIYTRSSSVRELIEDLSKPGSHIAQHAWALRIKGPVPWSALLGMLRLLPSLGRLDITSHNPGHEKFTVHPNIACLSCRMLAASQIIQALTELILREQKFHSAADVLRLFASLPRLSRAELVDCSIASTPELVPRASATNVTQLRLVVESVDVAPLVPLASLAQWWQWSHPAASPTNDLFPGLHITDSLAVCDMLKSLPIHSE